MTNLSAFVEADLGAFRAARIKARADEQRLARFIELADELLCALDQAGRDYLRADRQGDANWLFSLAGELRAAVNGEGK